MVDDGDKDVAVTGKRGAAPAKDTRSKDFERVRTTLLLKKGWHYLRYRHLREALKLIPKDSTVLGVGAGAGIAEVALAMEFPRMDFTVTNPPAARVDTDAANDTARQYGVKNVRFEGLDIMRPALRGKKFGMVYSVELLQGVADAQAAAANISALAELFVMTLVPFAEQEQAAGKSWGRASAGGFNAAQLIELFPNPMMIRGAYWRDAGQKLRDKLAGMENEEIKANAVALKQEAEADLKPQLPVRKAQALAMWTLALPNGS